MITHTLRNNFEVAAKNVEPDQDPEGVSRGENVAVWVFVVLMLALAVLDFFLFWHRAN
jgi:hypothetical protein